MSLLTELPQGFKKPEPLNKSFDMIVRDWSRNQFGGDDIVDEISKALGTGASYQGGVGGGTFPNQYGNGAVTSGNLQPGQATALRLENLDNTMTSVLATAEHLKIFRWLHKEPSKQPFYQWNRRKSYGSTRGAFGFKEGDKPTGGSGQWQRNGAYIKFLGTKGGVTHPVVLTNILGGMSMDPVAEDQLGRTMDFMQRIERAVMYGDDAILDDNNVDSNYSGILKQLTKARSQNVIDMKGQPLTLDAIANVAAKLVTEGKLLNFQDLTLFMSPRNIEDLGKLRYSTIYSQGSPGTITGPGTSVDRADLTTSARTNLIAGLSVVGQATSFGVIPFEWSIFTEPVESGYTLDYAQGAGDLNAPTAPLGLKAAVQAISTTAVQSNAAGSAATGSSFPTAAATYHYAVSAVSDAGESTATSAVGTTVASGSAAWTTGAVSVTSTAGSLVGQEIIVNIQYNLSNTQGAARALRIYRCDMASGGVAPSVSDPRWQYVGYVPVPATIPTGGVVFIDRNGTPELYNNIRPGTNIAPLLNRNAADLCIAQMSPLLKMPLAPTSTTFEYLLLLYHTLVLKAEERQFIFKNVGALT